MKIDYKHGVSKEFGKLTKFWFPDKTPCYITDKGKKNPKSYVTFAFSKELIEKSLVNGTYDVSFTREEIEILINMINKHEKGFQ